MSAKCITCDGCGCSMEGRTSYGSPNAFPSRWLCSDCADKAHPEGAPFPRSLRTDREIVRERIFGHDRGAAS